MLGKDHLTIALLIGIIVSVYLHIVVGIDMPSLLVFIFGVSSGSLLLDIDSPDSAINHPIIKGKNMDKLALFTFVNPSIAKITRTMVQPPLFLLRKSYPEVNTNHRGILHSLTGVLIISSVWFIIMSIITLTIIVSAKNFLTFTTPFIMAFPIGIFFGGIIHLLEDSLTFSGIQWLQPFSNMRVRGSIKTLSKHETKEKRLKLREREYIFVWYFVISTVVMLIILYILKEILFLILMIIWIIMTGWVWNIRFT